MALFDRASLVQIPSGYKEGKLYNIKPFDQPFEFERGSAATRVNEDGLIEQAGVSNTQLWNDDDVSSLGTGSYSNGVVTITASTGNDYVVFKSLEDVEANNYYEISFEAVVNSGSFVLLQGNGTAFSPNYLINESGSYSRIVQYTNALSGRLFFWSGNVTSLGVQFDGTISNISIKKVNLDTPRIDYTNGKALLLEPQRTNLVTNSEDFSQWQNGGGTQTIVANSTTSPQGLQNASSIQIDSGYVYKQVSGLSVLSGDKYTWSCYVNSASQKITFGGGSVAGTDVYSSEDSGNGWYRQKLTRTFTTSGSIIQPMFLDSISGTDLFYIWGAQLEQGSYATSYIPTNGQTETRLQDVCNGGGDENTFNDSEGTIFGELNIKNDINSSQAFITLSNGNINKRIVLYHSATDSFIFFIDGLGNIARISVNDFDNKNIFKFAAKYKNGDNALFINGSKIGTTNTSNIIDFDGLSEFSFQNPNGANKYEGSVKALTYFPEALTDTEIQTLTTI